MRPRGKLPRNAKLLARKRNRIMPILTLAEWLIFGGLNIAGALLGSFVICFAGK